ncbi:MAG: ABC-F family ATP-binding cassette domain-containing protein [Tepidisphaerales bacterium]
MPLLQLKHLEKSYGQRVLFSGVDFTLGSGERVGLVGDNGAGKSTLFRIAMGMDLPDGGEVVVPSGVRVGLLEQDPAFTSGQTVLDEAESAFAALHGLAHALRELEHRMAEPGADVERLMQRYTRLQHDYEAQGGYAWHHRLEATLLGVGLPQGTWDMPVSRLSGGQRSRLALAKLLIQYPDVLLLDEPTNHLDLEAIEWLEGVLLTHSGASWIISHDRYLLDRLATRIVDLRERRLTSYPGNFSAYLEQKARADLTRQRQYEAQQREIDKQSEYIRRFKAGQRARQAKGREKRLMRLLESGELVQRVEGQQQIHLRFHTDLRSGDRVLRVEGLRKSFGERVLWQDVAFELRRGERVGVVGPNGSGKSTLLRCVLGEVDADDGDVTWGANLRIGYYDQRLGLGDDAAALDADATVYEAIGEGRPLNDQQIRSLAALFLFHDDDVDKRLGDLSGGERARVRLAQLLADRPNVLVLDEPTNHLDVSSCAALEAAIAGFDGTVLCVSHDRYFLDRVVGRLLVLRPPALESYVPPAAVEGEPNVGTYSAWAERERRLRAERESAEKAREAAERERAARAKQRDVPKGEKEPRAGEPRKPGRDNPYLRPFGRLTLEQLEQRITETEVELAQLQDELSQAWKDAPRARGLQAELERLSRELEQLNEEYYGRA